MYTDSNLTQSLNGQCPPSASQIQGISEADPSRPSTATLPLETSNLDPPPVRILPFSRPLMKRTHTIATTGIPAGNVAAFGSTGEYLQLSTPYPELAPLSSAANKTQPCPSTNLPTQAETPRITVLKYSNPAAQLPAPAANPGGSQPVPKVPMPPLPSYPGLIAAPSNGQPITSCDQHQKHYSLESAINNIPTTTTAEATQQEPPRGKQLLLLQNIPLPTPEDLASYGSASTTERMQLVESWICRHVEDDAFLKLCEDVEGIWQRMKLGVSKGGT
ncbi:hypothetical protein BO86DRAFT_155777 [Aspergillus japonicus CBS 114.51]|uniref:Uncharacterized protein n=1 Tax=Aspergillus japonicus CBS 114.51 TaxID=1448312 RepID=A0A8T8WV44_ASPJA|nr:hypothetical protein BO86DRAFT_155777 [Aspergillus japonicus CBS 114.51]RAH79312.1 hypothetical protein BO86DRAFT_155777 [Aspergillus japonicus CBS 114.51]